MTKRLFLGIDVSTTGAKALLIDDKGAVVATATTPLTLSTPKPLWSEQDPHEWWSGTAKSIRSVLAAAEAKGADVAAVGLTGQMHGLVLLDAERNGAAAGHPLERPAHGPGVRRDPDADGRPRGARPGDRQRRPHRLHRAEDPVGAQPRARGLREGASRPAAEGLRAPAAHGRRGHGQGGRLGHPALRPGRAQLVEGGAGQARHSRRVAAADLRRTRGHRQDHGRGGGGNRTRRGNAGDRRRRGPGGGCGGRGRGHARRGRAHPGHVRRRLREHRQAAGRAPGPAPRLLPRRCPRPGTSWA